MSYICDWHFWVEVFKIVVGASLAWYAWKVLKNQYEVQRAKFRLDLFDRRYTIFMKAWEMCSLSSLGNDAIAIGRAKMAIQNALPESQFLLGSNMRGYLAELHTIANTADNSMRSMRYAGIIGREADVEDSNKWTAAIERLGEEANEGLRKHFAPFLDFAEWTTVKKQSSPETIKVSRDQK